MSILFESAITREQEIVAKIQNAIHEATGMAFEVYSTEKSEGLRKISANGRTIKYERKQNLCFARLIFAHHCDLNNIDFLRYFNFDRTMIYHYRRKYEVEKRYNPKFREIAMRVEEILNN